MEFTATQSELLRCLQTVEKAVATRDTSPSLMGVYMECDEGKLTVRGSDGELTIEAYTSIQNGEPGSLLLEAKFFIPLIRRLPAGEVVIKYIPEHQMLEIKAGSGNFKLQTMVLEDFPELNIGSREPKVNMPSSMLATMIRQTVYATHKDSGHSTFTGILMEGIADEVRLVATDSSRLCFNKQKISHGSEFRIIVPARTCSELLRILPNDEEQLVEISLLGNQVVFTVDNAIVMSRLLEGQYPDYNRVIPKGSDAEIHAPCLELASALERANLMGKKGPAIVTFHAEDGVLNLKSRDPDLGESTETLQVTHSGEEVKSSFQARYVLEMLKTVNDEKVAIGLTNGLNPGMIRPLGSEEYLYVLMPVRTV